MTEIRAEEVKALRDRSGAGMMECKRALRDADGDVERAVSLLRERGLAKAVRREGRATSEGTVAMALASDVGALVELGCETDFVAKTPEFRELAAVLARAVVSDASLGSRDALLAARVDGEKVTERIRGAIARIGENVALNRVARLAVNGRGCVGGYVHVGDQLGVLIVLQTGVEGASLEGLAKDLAMHVAAADPTPVAVDRAGVPEDLIAREREIYRRQAEQSGKPERVLDRIVDGRIKKFFSEVCLLEQPFVKDPDRTVGVLLREAGEQLGHEIKVKDFSRFRLGQETAS